MPVTHASIADRHLKLAVGTDKDPTQYSMTLAYHDHGALDLMGIPLGQWQRANDRDEMTVATHWAEPGPKTVAKEIAALQTVLKEMVDEDQAVRTTTPISWTKLEAVDQKHYPEIVRIYETYGWRRFSLVGKEAANNYWLLVQHQKLEFQEKVLPDLRRAVDAGESLEDELRLSVRPRDGKPGQTAALGYSRRMQGRKGDLVACRRSGGTGTA